MLSPLLYLVLLLVAISPSGFSESWQMVGPDSINWKNVRRISGKWLSPTSYRLAAQVDRSIALYESGAPWNYDLMGFEGSEWYPGYGYFSYEFSPWDDSVYIGHAWYYMEPSYSMYKARYPYLGRSNQLPGGCWRTPLNVTFGGNDSIVFATMCGLHRSFDRGRTWRPLEQSTSVYFSKVLAFDDRIDSVVYRAFIDEDRTKLYRSRNFGVNWDSLLTVEVRAIWNGDSPISVLAEGATILVGARDHRIDSTHDIGIFRSSNNGTSWSRVYAAGRVAGIVRSRLASNTLFAASENGILKSTDFGLTWSIWNNALPTNKLTGIIISPYSDTLFVSTETHGVLKVWSFRTDVPHEVATPTTFELEQNYPNPFNPTTTIKFQIPNSSFVTLKVFDLLGREVATLVNEGMQPGSYERVFDAHDLASGVYLYQMRTGNFVQTNKLLLVK